LQSTKHNRDKAEDMTRKQIELEQKHNRDKAEAEDRERNNFKNPVYGFCLFYGSSHGFSYGVNFSFFRVPFITPDFETPGFELP
jgi:hypothetical protein